MAVTSMARSSIADFQRANSMSGPVVKGVPVEYLVVAGGASGGSDRGGGGGAGGYRCNVSGENTGGGVSAEPAITLTAGTYALTVGAGGAKALSQSSGANGNPSIFGSIVSSGGGAGGASLRPGQPGGCGGGQGNNPPAWASTSGIRGQGFAGGNRNSDACGGGGGAGAVGSNAPTTTSGGAGGAGVASSITGSSVYRAGGGGGAGTSGSAGAGGIGGGGAGSTGDGDQNATSATANTGGGGGGATGGGAGDSGAGGSGVIIFGVPLGTSVSFSGGVSQTSATVGNNTVYTVTAAGVTDTFTIG